MAIRTELSLRLPNSPGALAGVCRLLSDERVNIVAMGLEASGQLRMVVDNHVHGGAVLREHHHQVTERDVILMAVPNSPGSLAPAMAGGEKFSRRIAQPVRWAMVRDASLRAAPHHEDQSVPTSS